MAMIVLVIQYIGLLIRIIFDSVNISIVRDFDVYFQNQLGQEESQKIIQTMKSNATALQAGVSSSKITALFAAGTFEVSTFLFNVVFIPFIMNL